MTFDRFVWYGQVLFEMVWFALVWKGLLESRFKTINLSVRKVGKELLWQLKNQKYVWHALMKKKERK